VAQTIIAHAREVWLAADHSKFNRPAMVELATLDRSTAVHRRPTPRPLPRLLADAQVR
jgi:DeoR family glycerol-3-phosphate regulon repressor